MKLQFLGTGAAEGVPAVFCGCATCKEVRKRGEKEFHSRSQLVIDDELSIDFPPDAYYHSLKFNADLNALKYILVTHSHMDHFYAHDFILRGYKYAYGLPSSKLQIFGNAEVKKVFEECTRRELRADVLDGLEFIELRPFTSCSFGAHSEYTVFPLKAQHSKTETALVFLLEKGDKTYLHLTDTGLLPTESVDGLEAYLKAKNKTIDFITFDCTFLFKEAGAISRHMGLHENKILQTEFFRRGLLNENTRFAITHYSHNASPFLENLQKAELEYGVIAAYDGLTVKL